MNLKEPDQVGPIRADAPLIGVDFLATTDAELGVEHLPESKPWIAARHRGHRNRGLHAFVEILLSLLSVLIVQMQAADKVAVWTKRNAKRSCQYLLNHGEAKNVVRQADISVI